MAYAWKLSFDDPFGIQAANRSPYSLTLNI